MKNKNVKIFAVLMAAASLTTTPVLAADSNDYILLLPKTEGITYEKVDRSVDLRRTAARQCRG